jgi:hypothetical protein
MTYEIAPYVIKITLVAGVDLSASQYNFIKLNGSGQAIPCAAATDVPIGVLQNAPKAGKEAEILVAGGTKIVGSAALAVGAQIGTTAAALAVAVVAGTDLTKYVLGTMLTATAGANELGAAVIDCVAPNRAA